MSKHNSRSTSFASFVVGGDDFYLFLSLYKRVHNNVYNNIYARSSEGSAGGERCSSVCVKTRLPGRPAVGGLVGGHRERDERARASSRTCHVTSPNRRLKIQMSLYCTHNVWCVCIVLWTGPDRSLFCCCYNVRERRAVKSPAGVCDTSCI